MPGTGNAHAFGVVTEAENEAAIAAYRSLGFLIEKFINVFSLLCTRDDRRP